MPVATRLSAYRDLAHVPLLYIRCTQKETIAEILKNGFLNGVIRPHAKSNRLLLSLGKDIQPERGKYVYEIERKDIHKVH